MLNSRTILLLSLSLFLSIPNTGRAQSEHDRVALLLSGTDCPSVRDMVTTALRQQTGVLQVDPNLVPDHVLIDIVRAHQTEEALTAIANQAIGGGQCRAEVMKSCITADMAAHLPSGTP
jgi:arginine deiminase